MRTNQFIQNVIANSLRTGANVIGEHDAKAILKAQGVPVVSETRANSPEAAGQAAAAMGFPVVLKALGPKIIHKTEAALVQVGLQSQSQVMVAANRMVSQTQAHINAFLVQPLIEGRRELVAGAFRDPLFGPVIMFGLGGIFTEALHDIVFKIAPLQPADIEDMFDELQSRDLLGPYRGQAAADKLALRQTLMGLSDLIMQFPEIKEIDINPMIVQPDGAPLAVDALIITGPASHVSRDRAALDLRSLQSCYYPKSVAFVGASGTLSKWGHMIVTHILNRGYAGKVYLVNPKGGQIVGRQAYRSVSEIEDFIDLAVITIPAAAIIDQIPLLKQKRVKAMLIISSGFSETGEAGKQLEKELVAAARQAQIMIFGPNTMGICNPHINFFCCGVHVHPLPGSTAVVCQSGNMGTQLLAFAEQQGIGIRSYSGSGNEAMVTMEDYMEALETDELTRTVVMYVESVKDGGRFFDSTRRLSRKKPVVVLKGGRTAQGETAAASHTGAMASNYRVFSAACRQAGVIQVFQPMDLLDLSAVFSSLPLPRGNRVAIMTLGGGWGVVTTDLCIEHGLTLPDLSADIVAQLDQILPDYWSHANPVDIVGENDPAIPMTTIEALLKWPGCDAVIHLGIHGRCILANRMFDSVGNTDPAYSSREVEQLKAMTVAFENRYIEHVVKLTETCQKPVLGVSLLTDATTKTLYRVDGCKYKGVFFPSPERAVKALAGMCRYRKWLENNGCRA